MLDKKVFIEKIIKKKNFCIETFRSFNSLSIDFLNDFSNELKKNKNIYKYPDLVYLLLWCNKKRIESLKKNFQEDEIRLGRGLIFHICPANVPTNFIYSFFFGLLSGNSNIVKIPSKDFQEKKIILSKIKYLFKKKKYNKLNKTNCFIQYDRKSENTKIISSYCVGRVIWGGDNTINEVRKIWIPEKSIEITFPDRYSISIINTDKLTQISKNELKTIGSHLNAWDLKPAGTEGYRTAEVTLGGVDTNAINSKTMEIKNHPGLFFIGEVVDVTGHLGGHNFQWAWSSGYSAGLVV